MAILAYDSSKAHRTRAVDMLAVNARAEVAVLDAGNMAPFRLWAKSRVELRTIVR